MSASWMQQAVVILAAAVVAVPVFSRLGVGAVLGYLTAGVIIGPWLLGLVGEVESILHFAELGVVLLLFVIGLELRPSRLWALRHPVFGLGTAQVVATGLVLSGVGMALGLPLIPAAMAGFALSLSSTALVLQLLAEKNQLSTHHGRGAFAVLLFQDLAAIPLLAIFPLFGGSGDTGAETGWLDAVQAVAMMLVVVIGGRWLLRPYLRLAASARVHDIFIAAALLVPLGTALLMAQVGLSMALGAFIAGVLLADSEYRHELEADIEPFKGLLLGLFFVAVGMSIDLGLVLRQPLAILGLTLGLVTIKAAVAYVLARLARHPHGAAANVALYLSQGGEFAFILFGVAAFGGAMERALADLLTVVVSLSMVITPVMAAVNDRWLHIGKRTEAPPFDPIEPPQDHRVIIAGFGRFGQMVARTLRMRQIPFTALEASFEQVDFVRRFGNRIHYGDASRLELLRAARADLADVLVLAIDDVDASVKTVEMVRKHFPRLKIYARARNRQHAYRLMDLGVDRVIRETFLSSLELARDVLVGLGHSIADADDAIRRFRRHDEELLARQHAIYENEAQLMAATRAGAAELERLFEEDAGRNDSSPARTPRHPLPTQTDPD